MLIRQILTKSHAVLSVPVCRCQGCIHFCFLKVLSKYRSGKLPKAFKIIPALSNWEQILYITDPETWTAAAMYQATR